MAQRRPVILLFVLLSLAIAAVWGLFTANKRFTASNPGGNDFLVHWVGTRAFLMDGLSPYSDEVAVRIQTLAYGRPALPGEHELRVAYPLYSTVIFAPFSLVADFPTARAAWMTALEIVIFSLALATLRLTRWSPGLPTLFVFFLFSFVWYQAVRPLINGNAVILVALFYTLALLAIRDRRDELAGALLTLSTIKPQVVILPILFVLVWAAFHRRWLLIGWLVGATAGLTALMMIFIPDWLLQNLREVVIYSSYNPPGTPGSAFAEWMPAIGQRLGLALTIIIAAVLLFEWWAALGKDHRWFLWTASLTLAASGWSGIQTDPGNFIVMYPALVLIFAVWEERWGLGGRLAGIFSMVLLFAGLWWLFLTTVDPGPQPQQDPIMFFPLPFFLLLGLYWVRWSAISPPKLWLEEMRARELTG